MKKLYLSSYKFGNAPEALGSLAAPNAKGAIIMNATDVFGPERRAEQVAANREALAGLGVEADELDLRDYFQKPDELARALDRYGLVWVVGGNAFVLRRAMRYSGFDKLATERVLNGSLVYAGFSAGAVVATPTLAGIDIVDDPVVTPDGYASDVVWEGLGLVSFSIAPHYRSNHSESLMIEDVVQAFEAKQMPYRTLRDGEAIVVHDDEDQVVGREGSRAPSST